MPTYHYSQLDFTYYTTCKKYKLKSNWLQDCNVIQFQKESFVPKYDELCLTVGTALITGW